MQEPHQSSTFCSRPWNELHIEEDGSVTPCCVMPSNRFPMGDSIKKYLTGNELENLKRLMINSKFETELSLSARYDRKKFANLRYKNYKLLYKIY